MAEAGRAAGAGREAGGGGRQGSLARRGFERGRMESICWRETPERKKE